MSSLFPLLIFELADLCFDDFFFVDLPGFKNSCFPNLFFYDQVQGLNFESSQNSIPDSNFFFVFGFLCFLNMLDFRIENIVE